MKQSLLILGILLSTTTVFAQFGGGTGTAEDPYQIWNKSHWDELADSYNVWLEDSIVNTCSDTTGYLGVHFRLMADIDEVIEKCIPYAYNYDTASWEFTEVYFNGFFHGGGHSINVKINDEFESNGQGRFLFLAIGESAIVDSIEVIGSPVNFRGIIKNNSGIVRALISNLTEITGLGSYPNLAGICYSNGLGGLLENCTNKTNFSIETGGSLAGICLSNSGTISYCKNFGNLYMKNGPIGGIVHGNGSGLVTCCINHGIISSGENPAPNHVGFGGICYCGGQINNCINIGNVSSSIKQTGGICGTSSNIQNCANYGIINCTYPENGGISGSVTIHGVIIRNNLNVAKTSNSAIAASAAYSVIANNFYDKQMCLSKGIAGEDIPDSAEGKLTTQLTGTSPELQAMLGDGWSYAEGRYPIPLGLENDSLALVAATPVYLHFETEEDYNHVDSVSKNFTVGLENNVSWEQANGRVSFSDESVTLINLGFENITVNLGDYSKKVRINIVDIETSAPIQTIETGITAYPNPAGEFISLNLNGINAERVDVYDITGKLLSTNNLSSEQTLIFTGNLHSGLYFLKVYDGNRNITILKFTKN